MVLNDLALKINNKYEIESILGKGCYARVWKAKDKTGDTVAIKHIICDKTDVKDTIRCFREITYLKKLKHKHNIIHMRNCYLFKNEIYLIFDYHPYNLTSFIKSVNSRNINNRTYIMTQILKAMNYIHNNGIMHRDIKPDNILINDKLEIIIADFGLVSQYKELSKEKTNYVITRWYRPPELLLQYSDYDEKCDVWSIGCIMAEMILGFPMFPGKTSEEQIMLIVNYLGINVIDGIEEIKDYKHKIKERYKSSYIMIHGSSEDELKLMKDLLKFKSKERISCGDALKYEICKMFKTHDNDNILLDKEIVSENPELYFTLIKNAVDEEFH